MAVPKTADERLEQIEDTVRRTEVEVDRDTDVGTGRTGSAFGTTNR